jgi:exosortase A-associated hydrolase 1
MEKPIEFYCNQNKLYGILHLPQTKVIRTAVTIVTGGPQTRIGSHRLYVLLARYLCRHGFAVLRFDYEGLGDSEGPAIGFQKAARSILAAQDFLPTVVGKLEHNIIWTICDGCLAAVEAALDCKNRYTGLILCNPYIFNESERARHTLLHNYISHLNEYESWAKIIDFRKGISKNISKFFRYLWIAAKVKVPRRISSVQAKDLQSISIFKDKILGCNIPVHFLLGEQDLVASDFYILLEKYSIGKKNKNNCVSYLKIREADHTFVNPMARETMFRETLEALFRFTMNHSDKYAVH